MSLISSSRVLGIVRFRESGDVAGVLTALTEGGIDLLEVTIDTPDALDAVAASSGVGVGSEFSMLESMTHTFQHGKHVAALITGVVPTSSE